jgi:DNA repair protein RadC
VRNVELLGQLLGSIRPATELIHRFGSLARIERAGIAEMIAAGIDRAAAERIRAALALGRRLCIERAQTAEPLRTAEDVWRRFAPRLQSEIREHFWAVALDSQMRVLAETEIAVGWATGVAFLARDAFRMLVAEAAVSALFLHNHPSGDPTPSDHDRTLTTQLISAGELLGIRVIDHVVVAHGGYASALHEGGRGVLSPQWGESPP